MDPNLRLVSIKVEDMNLMERFYNRLLKKEPAEVEEGRLLEYKFNGGLFGLYNPAADESGPDEFQSGNNVVPAFKLGEDYSGEKRRIEDMVDLVYEADESGHNWFVFEDPEGNRIEMYRGSRPE